MKILGNDQKQAETGGKVNLGIGNQPVANAICVHAAATFWLMVYFSLRGRWVDGIQTESRNIIGLRLPEG